MLAFGTLVSFIVTSLIVESTPGPNMGYLAILSASKGRHAGFAATAGVALGLLIIGVAAALGLAVVISNSPVLYHGLRWGGVLYLLWLAWDCWKDNEKEISDMPDISRHSMLFFRRGLITNLLNPKAAVFYIAVLPGFTDPALPLIQQAILLTFIYVAVATFVHGFIVAMAGTLRPWLEEPRRNALARKIFAILLAIIALWFASGTAI